MVIRARVARIYQEFGDRIDRHTRESGDGPQGHTL